MSNLTDRDRAMTDTGMKVWMEARDARYNARFADGRVQLDQVVLDQAAAAVITAAMAQDKARIAELEEALGLLLDDWLGFHDRDASIGAIAEAALTPLEARNVTDA